MLTSVVLTSFESVWDLLPFSQADGLFSSISKQIQERSCCIYIILLRLKVKTKDGEEGCVVIVHVCICRCKKGKWGWTQQIFLSHDVAWLTVRSLVSPDSVCFSSLLKWLLFISEGQKPVASCCSSSLSSCFLLLLLIWYLVFLQTTVPSALKDDFLFLQQLFSGKKLLWRWETHYQASWVGKATQEEKIILETISPIKLKQTVHSFEGDLLFFFFSFFFPLGLFNRFLQVKGLES